MTMLVGRERERNVLRDALRSSDPELIAVFGRRRVGKTFLVRQFFGDSIAFELVGTHSGDTATQLRAFASSLSRASGSPGPLATPATWSDAFDQLAAQLGRWLARRRDKLVVFFDELPWLATRRSGFLSAFEYFWNAWASRHSRLIVVICGSAASWMLRKVVRQRGGLHNRVTRRIRLEPFSLCETEALLRSQGADFGRYDLLELYMALGGVPHYLKACRPGESVAQNIDRLCFARDGLLRTEFTSLYASLFEQAGRHEAVVRALAATRHGMTRGRVLASASLATGGASTQVLAELEESGLIASLPALGHRQRETIYRLADPYSRFYIAWIERRRGRSDGAWLRLRATPRWRAWSGLTFEAIALDHVRGIKRALGIAGVATEEAAWQHRGDPGAQIDLVIDREDRCMNLCEMKFAESEIVVDKRLAHDLSTKRDVFRAATRTRKTLVTALVTTFGVKDNGHARRLGARVVTMDALFTDEASR
jgi:hypothetical protein